MEVVDLVRLLAARDDLMAVIHALGTYCLDNRDDVQSDRYVAQDDRGSDLRELMAVGSEAMWDLAGRAQSGPSQTLVDKIESLSLTPGLAAVTLLEGICAGAGRLYFANASSVVSIRRGLVAPLPERWLGSGFGATPHPAKLHPNLLEHGGLILWESDWVLELDYRFRDRLDMVCAIPTPDNDKQVEGRPAISAYALPNIATVHPFDSSAMASPEIDEGRKRFFGVYRKACADDGAVASAQDSADENHKQVFEALLKVGDKAPIAVLPECCLHSPDGLDELLKGAAQTVPDLVVAGSAHTVDGNGVRANTSRVYLDRYPILNVSKRQPFVLNRGELGEYYEDLAPTLRSLRIAAGTTTRLGVAICADLNSPNVLDAMEWAGVNILLVPSWTPTIGGFADAIGRLAGSCQCVGVVANVPDSDAAKSSRSPFWALSAVPRERDGRGNHVCPDEPPAVGVLNPNLPSTEDGYWTWIR